MSTKARGRTNKRTLLLKIEGADAVAFSKACEAAEPLGVAPGRRPARFAAWLLARAAEAYACAPRDARERFWKFVLERRDFEESAAWEICWQLERGGEFQQLKRKRVP